MTTTHGQTNRSTTPTRFRRLTHVSYVVLAPGWHTSRKLLLKFVQPLRATADESLNKTLAIKMVSCMVDPLVETSFPKHKHESC